MGVETNHRRMHTNRSNTSRRMLQIISKLHYSQTIKLFQYLPHQTIQKTYAYIQDTFRRNQFSPSSVNSGDVCRYNATFSLHRQISDWRKEGDRVPVIFYFLSNLFAGCKLSFPQYFENYVLHLK